MPVNPHLTVTSTGDMEFIKEAVNGLKQGKVYVGIPDANSHRNQHMIGPQLKGQAITNAGLLYIHTNGSTRWNIPPRPVIEPTIRANQKQIDVMMGSVAKLTLDGKVTAANAQLKKVGQFASNRCKDWFFDSRNGWAQDAPATIRRKLQKMIKFRINKKGQKVMRGGKANKAYLNAMTVLGLVNQYRPRYGLTPLDSINSPLIDTDEMRRAITYVVEEIKAPPVPPQQQQTVAASPTAPPVPSATGGIFGGVNIVPAAAPTVPVTIGVIP